MVHLAPIVVRDLSPRPPESTFS